jgi:hypothetical protein
VAGEAGDGRDVEVRAGACENCARDDDELVAVRRVYLTPASWDSEGSETVVEDVEWWCFSCRSQYPHRVVG